MKKSALKKTIAFHNRIARDTWLHISRAQLPQVASSLSYTTILSLIPLLAVSFAIFKAFGGLDRIYGMIEPFILDNLAEGVSDEVIGTLKTFISNAHAKTIGVGGLVGLIFTSMSMLWSADKAINKIWDAPLKRSWFLRISGYGLFVTIGPLALAVVLGFATSGHLPITHFFPNGTGLFLITTAFFYFIYKWVPHTPVDSKYAWVSALLAAIAFNIARLTYATYIAKAVSYNKIYGSLSAVPILLLWIYIVWLVILSGAALTAALQKNNLKRAAIESC
jgi:membrane protein